MLIALLSASFSGCIQTNQESSNDTTEQSKSYQQADQMKRVEMKAAVKWQQATVKYFNIEGGFYGLITEQGQKYLPMNLAKEFQQDGALVNIKGQLKKGMMTTQQWGTPYEISEIKLIKAGKNQLEDSL